MKKIIFAAVTLILLFSLTACSKESQSPSDTTLNHLSEQRVRYMTFEELVAASTDIIKGKCVGINHTEKYSEYEFYVVNRYLGEDVSGNIFVYVPKNNVSVIGNEVSTVYDIYSYNTNDLDFKEGFEYYLVLSRRVSVYLSRDRYINIGGNLFMPANDIANSSLYGEPITKHSQLESIDTEKDLSDYLSKLACEMIDNKQTKPFVGTAYITDTDIDSVIDKSDFIFKIKVGEEVFKGVADDRYTFDCTVISSLKGSATKDEIARIVFPMGTVEEGKEYIVALTELPDCSPRTFVMSSKNSIYELSSQEYIEARLSLN